MPTIFQVLNSPEPKCSLVPFIMAGAPDLETTEKAIKILDNAGADIIEIGLPYSDPLADGPIIQEASKQALAAGVNVDQIFRLLSSLHTTTKAPLVLFTYYNPILARGLEKFVRDTSEAGIKGLIVPDLPLEEVDYTISLCQKYNLELILLITPITPDSRVDKILSKAQGTVYIVSSTGVTGLRQDIKEEMESFVSSIREKSNQKLILGFGISTPEHVRKISQWNIDGIVMGSAFVQCLSIQDSDQGLRQLHSFCSNIKSSFV